MILPSRSQLIRDSSLTKTDLLEIATCREDPHRLGFAYQLGFVRAFQRFPVQQPLGPQQQPEAEAPKDCTNRLYPEATAAAGGQRRQS